MRHQFNTVFTFCGPKRTKKSTEPCKQWNIEKFTGTTSAKFKILKFIAENPNCTRKDVIYALHPELKNMHFLKRPWNGWHSCVISNLLWKDYIDYNSKFEYHITTSGTRLLMKWLAEI